MEDLLEKMGAADFKVKVEIPARRRPFFDAGGSMLRAMEHCGIEPHKLKHEGGRHRKPSL